MTDTNVVQNAERDLLKMPAGEELLERLGIYSFDADADRDAAMASVTAEYSKLAALVGKTIRTIVLDPEKNVLTIGFHGGKKIAISDEMRQCCERRFMRTDDSLADFVGYELRGIKVVDVPDPPPDLHDDGDTREVQFLVVETDGGNAVFSCHNWNNGYYCGFAVLARLIS